MLYVYRKKCTVPTTTAARSKRVGVKKGQYDYEALGGGSRGERESEGAARRANLSWIADIARTCVSTRSAEA